LTCSVIIQQQTELKKPTATATYICNFANAIPQTQKLQKNVAVPPKKEKRPPKKNKLFLVCGIKITLLLVDRKFAPKAHNNGYKI